MLRNKKVILVFMWLDLAMMIVMFFLKDYTTALMMLGLAFLMFQIQKKL